MTYQKNFSFLTAVLFVSLLFTGCDQHKQKRADLMKQISDLNAQIGQSKNRHAQLTRAVESLSADLQTKAAALQDNTNRKQKLKDELSAYLLDHKAVTLSLMATGGGAAAIAEENMDEDTRTGLGVIGIIGAIYCLANAEECGSVTTKILYYGGEIKTADTAINDLTSQISSGKGSLEKQKQELTSVSDLITKTTKKRDDLQGEHDSLLCKVCF